MTLTPVKSERAGARMKSLLISIICGLAFVLFFLETDVIIERMRSGLTLVGGIIIPTLFPYMVLSEIIILSRLSDLIERISGDAFSKIFNLPKCCAPAFVLGIVCGFPIGTRIAHSLYEKGKINDYELFHLLLFCNIQSFSFIVNTVGSSLLKSKIAGIILYVVQVISLVLIGLILGKIKSNKYQFDCTKYTETKLSKNTFAESFTASIKSGVAGILNISGFVLFFYVLCGVVMDLPLPLPVSLALCGTLEMSCGCVEIVKNLEPAAAFFACAMVLGFSGISLHFQILSFCKDAKIHYRKFFALKILTAIVTGILAVASNFIFKIFT